MIDESFVLSRENEDEFSLSNYKETTKLELNPTKLQTYLGSFRKLNSEGFISGSLNVDSILNVKPVFDLVVSNNKGVETTVTAYYKKAKDGTHVDGDVTMRDPERMYAHINKTDWVIIQLNSFGSSEAGKPSSQLRSKLLVPMEANDSDSIAWFCQMMWALRNM